MHILHQISDLLRPGRTGNHAPASADTTAHWRRRAELASLQRDLDETADEQAFIEAETARSREHAARLDAEAAAAAADGCAIVAYELREELNQTHVFLAELSEIHHAVITERARLSMACRRLTDQLTELGRPVGPTDTGTGPSTGTRAGAEDGGTDTLTRPGSQATDPIPGSTA